MIDQTRYITLLINIYVGQSTTNQSPRVQSISNSAFHLVPALVTLTKTIAMVVTKQGLFYQKMVAPIAVSSPKSTLLQNPIYFGDLSSSFVGGSLKCLCFNLKPRPQRRELTNLVVASATPSVTNSNASGRFYFNFTGFPFPLGPFLNRRSIRTEVMPSCFVLCLVWITIMITELIWLRFSVHWVTYLWLVFLFAPTFSFWV